MLLLINGGKTGVAVGAAEGLDVGGVIGVKLVLFAALSGVGIGGASCRKEDVGPMEGCELEVALFNEAGCL